MSDVSESDLIRAVQRHLVRFILVILALGAVLLAGIRYDLVACTPWILGELITAILGWAMALYGLFWIAWWLFGTIVEGGEQRVTLYGVTWAPLTGMLHRTGPYEWVRYPLAFGSLEFLWGLSFMVHSTTLVIRVVPILAVATWLYLRLVEDRKHLRAHEQTFRLYRKKTPLLIPTIPTRAAVARGFKRRKRG